MESLREADVPIPREFLIAAEQALVADLRHTLTAPGPLPESAWDALKEARAWELDLPLAGLEPLIRARVERHLLQADGLFILDHLRETGRVLDFARDGGITVNLWQAQNLFARLAPRLAGSAAEVREALRRMAERLGFSLESLEAG
jgi:hypothetical protein